MKYRIFDWNINISGGLLDFIIHYYVTEAYCELWCFIRYEIFRTFKQLSIRKYAVEFYTFKNNTVFYVVLGV